MDISKDYYESVMRNFKTYGRRWTLEQYCCDKAVDYKWIDKAKELYAPEATGCSWKSSETRT